jgi:NAD(P)-dependent dehydrogenase (short-subunit alcohol dehydrogenase family)
MNILITGCSRGIGRGFVEKYLARKEVEKLFAVTTNADSLKGLVASSGGRLTVIPLSVSEASSVAKLKEALNGVALDLLVNCAGTYPEDGGGFEKLTAAVMDEGIHVNTYSVMYTLQGALPALKRGKQVKVISMTSLMGSIADNSSGGSVSYRVSKTALNMLNKCFSLEFRNFTSVVFHPGWVQTDMGGNQAPTTIEQSVSGMMQKIDALKPSDNGGFFDFEGDAVEW